MMRIAVTGADGFVGRHLCRLLVGQGHEIIPLVRDSACAVVYETLDIPGPSAVIVGDIGPDTDWTTALAGVDAVIHLAARVHVMNERKNDPLSAFRAVNTAGTACLARCAAVSGVRRLVYISTIKVNGEGTAGRAPFRESDSPSPVDPYALSKHEAEIVLKEIADQTGLEIAIVRPPLVHGPGVGGNLLRLLRQVAAGRPLPLRGQKNRRSLVGVNNLADVLALCAIHPAAAGHTFLVSDRDALTIEELVRAMADGLGRSTRLFPIPAGVARFLLGVLGRGAIADRLFDELLIDSSKIRSVLDWQPPLAAYAGILEMCRDYRENIRQVIPRDQNSES